MADANEKEIKNQTESWIPKTSRMRTQDLVDFLSINNPTKNDEEAVLALIKAGVDYRFERSPDDNINYKGPMGGNLTLLHLAAKNYGPDIISRLVPNSELDAWTDNGMRPLHYAVIGNKIDNVRLLIDAGADMNAFTTQGETPLQMAKKRNIDPAIIALLEQAVTSTRAGGNRGHTGLSDTHGSGKADRGTGQIKP